MKQFFLFILFLVITQVNFAQIKRVTEEDVQLQSVFIEGNKEKILGNYEKAVEIFQQVLEKDRKNAAAAYELSRLFDLQEDTEGAIKYAKKAVENESDNQWYQLFLADLFLKNNQDADAASLFEGLVEQDPNVEDYYYKWAYFLVRSGEPAKAVEVYNMLQEKVGINEETSRRKHSLYLGMGDYKNAQKEAKSLGTQI